MRKSLCTFILLLATSVTIGYAVPVCTASGPVDQVAFSPSAWADGPRIVGRVRNVAELNERMMGIIRSEMGIRYTESSYVNELRRQLCRNVLNCVVDILSQPTIQLIPTVKLTSDVPCNRPAGCYLEYSEATTVSTTHSVETGFSVEVNSAPFGMGVTFSTSVTLGFSVTNEESTTITYGFNMENGDFGAIAIVSAQISGRARLRGCACPSGASQTMCEIMCRMTPGVGGPNIDRTGYHEAVIMDGRVPSSLVAFVSR